MYVLQFNAVFMELDCCALLSIIIKNPFQIDIIKNIQTNKLFLPKIEVTPNLFQLFIQLTPNIGKVQNKIELNLTYPNIYYLHLFSTGKIV